MGTDIQGLKRGLYFAKKEDAIAAKAMLPFKQEEAVPARAHFPID